VIVAIDGGVASGKSAAGRRLAERLGLPFVDTGLMYRAMARLAQDAGIDPADAEGLGRLAGRVSFRVEGDRVWAGDQELSERIYDAELNSTLSRVAANARVREALVRRQRSMAEGGEGVVMAGRDIGTVVFPKADLKFFLVASLEVKVRRRAAQLARRGSEADPETMAGEVRERDRADSEREVAPMRPAPDAIVVDTDRLSLAEVVELMLSRVEEVAGA
jgi:cytidylate kinase